MLLVVFMGMSIISFVMMYLDKQKAKKNQYRISEQTLWLIAIFGGAVGGTIGMELFRHKTKHTTFKYGFPLLAIVQVGALFFWS